MFVIWVDMLVFPMAGTQISAMFLHSRSSQEGPNLSSVTKGSTGDKYTHIDFLGLLTPSTYFLDLCPAHCIMVRLSKESLKIRATYNSLCPSNF